MSGRPNKHDFTFNSNYQFALDQWVTDLESTITTQTAALRLAVEAFGPLGKPRYFCTKCGSIDPEEVIGDTAVCACGYCMFTSAPKPEHVAALTACREAMTTTRLDRASIETEG